MPGGGWPAPGEVGARVAAVAGADDRLQRRLEGLQPAQPARRLRQRRHLATFGDIGNVVRALERETPVVPCGMLPETSKRSVAAGTHLRLVVAVVEVIRPGVRVRVRARAADGGEQRGPVRADAFVAPAADLRSEPLRDEPYAQQSGGAFVWEAELVHDGRATDWRGVPKRSSSGGSAHLGASNQVSRYNSLRSQGVHL